VQQNSSFCCFLSQMLQQAVLALGALTGLMVVWADCSKLILRAPILGLVRLGESLARLFSIVGFQLFHL